MNGGAKWMRDGVVDEWRSDQQRRDRASSGRQLSKLQTHGGASSGPVAKRHTGNGEDKIKEKS